MVLPVYVKKMVSSTHYFVKEHSQCYSWNSVIKDIFIVLADKLLYLLELRSKLNRRVSWIRSGWVADDKAINQGVKIRLEKENEHSIEPSTKLSLEPGLL